MSYVVIITDVTDVAVNEIRSAIIGDSNQTIKIEPSVPVYQFSALHAMFNLRLLCEAYPDDSVFVVVVNAEQERPARLVARLGNGQVVLSANTGALSWAIRDFGLAELYELHDHGWVPFGGKAVYGPACARLLKGEHLANLGKKFPPENIRHIRPEVGEVVHVDNFGLAKFFGAPPTLEIGSRVSVHVDHETVEAKIVRRMMDEPTGTWTIYKGSSLDLFEFGRVRRNGAVELGISPGTRLQFGETSEK